ncbi:hypothetical protein FCV25MIE_35037, partial [Fagus crenata]
MREGQHGVVDVGVAAWIDDGRADGAVDEELRRDLHREGRWGRCRVADGSW